jgi:hypothetical protein
MQIAANRVKGVFFLFDLIKSGVSPGPDDPKAWCDRAICAIGGVMIRLVLFFNWIQLCGREKANWLKSLEPPAGIEPATCWLRISRSTNWARVALKSISYEKQILIGSVDMDLFNRFLQERMYLKASPLEHSAITGGFAEYSSPF